MVQALAYFQELSDALHGTQVSDRGGCALSLEDATAQLLRSAAFATNTTRNPRPKLILVGNGGSAAIASHVQNDLCKALGARAMVFNEPSLLTALTNDIDYASAFEYLVGLWAEPDDWLLAISSSGRSANILRAVKAANDSGSRVATFSGFQPDNPLRRLGDVNFYVSSCSYGIVELAHSALLHYVTDRAVVEHKPEISAQREAALVLQRAVS
jgi:D-sedoheptulose 7-phosphate isomerase